jgi:hypothetical protein
VERILLRKEYFQELARMDAVGVLRFLWPGCPTAFPVVHEEAAMHAFLTGIPIMLMLAAGDAGTVAPRPGRRGRSLPRRGSRAELQAWTGGISA